MSSLNLPNDPVRAADEAYFNLSATVTARDLEMARIEADKATKLAETRRKARADRQPIVGGILAGVAVLLFLLALVGAVSYAVEQDRVKTGHENVRQAQIAAACIAAGNIWIDGNCIPSRKSP